MLVTRYKTCLAWAGMLTALLATAAAPRAGAVDTLISGFNGDLTSAFGTSWELNATGWSTANVGTLSEGSGALRVYHNTGWEAGLKLPGNLAMAQAIVANDTLEFDIVTPYGIDWRQVAVVLNQRRPEGSGSGWNQTAQIDVSYPTETAPFQHIVLDLTNVNGNNWKTLAQEWINNPVEPPAPDWFELLFAFQGNDGVYSADFNFDLEVNSLDFLIWQQNFGHQEAGPDQGDATADFLVDAADLQQWMEQFSRRQIDPFVIIDNVKFVDNTPASAIPEPGTLAAGVVGLALFASSARRRRVTC